MIFQIIKVALLMLYMAVLKGGFNIIACIDSNNDFYLSKRQFIFTNLIVIFIVAFDVPLIIILEIGILLFLSYMDCKCKQVYCVFVALFIIISAAGSVTYNFSSFIPDMIVGIFFYCLCFIKVYAKADGGVMFGIVHLFAMLGENVLVCSVIYFFLVEILLGTVTVFKMIFLRANLFKTKIPAISYMTAVFVFGLVSGLWEEIMRGGIR